MNLPDHFVTGLDERGRFTFQRWCPPRVGGFATPSDPSRIITAFREWVRANSRPGFQPVSGRGAVSAGGLEQLLLLAYRASFSTDEGRCTRARLFVPDVDRQAHPLRINHLFNPPRQLTGPALISQLAPALVADDFALVVQEVAGELVCTGVTLLGSGDANRSLLGMPRGWTGASALALRLASGVTVLAGCAKAPARLRPCSGRRRHHLGAGSGGGRCVLRAGRFGTNSLRWGGTEAR